MSANLAATQQSAALRKSPAATPPAGVRSAVRLDAAANDDTPTSEFSIFGDPLWGMAIGSVIFFVVLAALIAAS
jgi:hypothetical protein